MVTSIVRPRFGDLEAATRPHESIPSGEYVGRNYVEVCDLCGLTRANRVMHPDG